MQLRFHRLTRAVMMRQKTASALCGATVHTDPDSRRRWENRWQKRLR